MTLKKKGGGFIYWPGTHLNVHRYFRQHPEHIDGSFLDADDWNHTKFSHGSKPVEFVAAAGTVLLWHGFLSHNGSTNVKSSPRNFWPLALHQTTRDAIRHLR